MRSLPLLHCAECTLQRIDFLFLTGIGIRLGIVITNVHVNTVHVLVALVRRTPAPRSPVEVMIHAQEAVLLLIDLNRPGF